jgi:hypothetical protein
MLLDPAIDKRTAIAASHLPFSGAGPKPGEHAVLIGRSVGRMR